MPQTEQFGSDTYTARNVFEIILLLIGLAVMGFFAINTTLWQTAQVFWFLGLTATITVIAAFLVPRGVLNFNVPISGPPLVPVPRKALYAIFAVLGLLTFFVMSQTSYRIAAPKFQILEPGLEGNVVLSTFAAIFENDFFFVSLAGIIFSLIFWKTRNPWVSFGALLLIVPMIFMSYHIGVYGIDSVESWAVFLFGFEMTMAMIVLRDVTYLHVRHIANNLGLLVFEIMDVQTFLLTLASSWLFWTIVLLALGLLALSIMKKRR